MELSCEDGSIFLLLGVKGVCIKYLLYFLNKNNFSTFGGCLMV